MNVSLEGKIAIITGAASGIGLAIVEKYLQAGAAGIVAVDIADELPGSPNVGASAGRLRHVRGDVSVEQTAVNFTRTALDAFGRIDVLVNNAAVSVVRPLHEHSPDEWDTTSMNTNSVKSGLLGEARHVIPVMIRQRGGVILNSGSISGQIGIATQGAYAPSKGAIHQMTRQMAVEYAPHGIRVNAICCGTVDTPIVHKSAAAFRKPRASIWAMLRDNHPIGPYHHPRKSPHFSPTWPATSPASSPGRS